MIFGVCGGLADHLDLPAWAVRIGFILLAGFNQAFILLYLGLAIFMKSAPREPFRSFEDEEVYNSYQTSRGDTLDRVERTFRNIEKRLQNVESVVTRPGYEHEDEFRKL
jgi:phage shock protein C